MTEVKNHRRIIEKFDYDDYLITQIDGYLVACRARNLAVGSVLFYRQKLKEFTRFCDSQAVTNIRQIDGPLLRQYLLWLAAAGHNPGGVHGGYRTIRAFIRWWINEVEPDDYKDPTKKVKAPKVPEEIIEPVSLEDVSALLSTCHPGEYVGERDKALILALLDTGARASEFCAIDLEDVDLTTGEILIRQGKGRKPRKVYLGKHSRKALRTYLKKRKDDNSALWLSSYGERITTDSLHSIMQRRAAMAGIPCPGLHDFRRAFAINMLRAGVDIFSLQVLMGHSDIQILRKYLKQTDQDGRRAHELGSPVDVSLKGSR